MPYASGESPKMGDYVKNKYEQPGTVTAVHVTPESRELIDIRWDERMNEQWTLARLMPRSLHYCFRSALLNNNSTYSAVLACLSSA
ncbi:MAG: hypothetical protein WBQ59_28990 [Candidatus Acidiferrum sp.]